MPSKPKPKPRRPNRIAEHRRAKKWSQQDLADAVGAHWITISKLERDQMQLTSTWLERLALALDVEPEDFLPKRARFRRVLVEGELNVGGFSSVYSVPRERDIETDFQSEQGVAQWMEVEGEALWPIFQPKDLIKFIPVDVSDADEYLGRLCILVLEGKTNGLLDLSPSRVGFLDKGSTDTLYDIRPMNGPPFRDLIPISLWVAYEARFTLLGCGSIYSCIG